MRAVQVQHYIRRATDFFHGMQLTRQDKDYRSSSALLAIHSAVSYSDALRTGLGDSELSADDHRQAADNLRKLLSSRKTADQSGLDHLKTLLAKKSLVAYGNSRIHDSDYQLLFNKAERFAKWANNIGSQLNIEGWHDGDQ